MDKYHRDKLDNYCNILVPKINLERLLPKLVDNGVYNKDDINMVKWKKRLNDIETVKDVYLTIKTRGPDAFRNLLLSLKQSDHNHLADILSPRSESATNNNDKASEYDCSNISPSTKFEDKQRKVDIDFEHNNGEMLNDNYYKIMQISDEPLHVKVVKATEFRDGPVIGVLERYPLRSNPRGMVLIINNVNFKNLPDRLSSLVDEKNLYDLFNQMGFQVSICRNLTGKDMKKTVRDFSIKNKFNNVDSCFVIICSHGCEAFNNDRTEIQCTDWGELNYETVTDKDILDNFTTKNCLELAGKPKIFIFQMCRGSKKQDSVNRNATDGYDTKILAVSEKAQSSPSTGSLKNNREIPESMRNYSDTLVAYSTVPGYVSFRDTINGSWFINIFCEVFMNYAHQIHIQDMFNLIDRRLEEFRNNEGHCQTLVSYYIGFNRHCYLNPGYFRESS